MFRLLREVSGAPVIDLARLLEAVIFNYLAGDNDAHGKNLSLLYRGVGTGDLEIRLSALRYRQHRVPSRTQPGHGDEDRR